MLKSKNKESQLFKIKEGFLSCLLTLSSALNYLKSEVCSSNLRLNDWIGNLSLYDSLEIPGEEEVLVELGWIYMHKTNNKYISNESHIFNIIINDVNNYATSLEIDFTKEDKMIFTSAQLHERANTLSMRDIIHKKIWLQTTRKYTLSTKLTK